MTWQNKPPPDVISSRMDAGERLIWWARPVPRHLMRWQVGRQMVLGFCLMVPAFGLWGAAAAGDMRIGLVAMLLSVVALWLLSTPLRRYFAAARTAYALTDRRALIVNRLSSMSFPLEMIDFVETMSSQNGGTSHVLFYEELPLFRPRHMDAIFSIRKSGFLAISDCEWLARNMLLFRAQRRTADQDAEGYRSNDV